VVDGLARVGGVELGQQRLRVDAEDARDAADVAPRVDVAAAQAEVVGLDGPDEGGPDARRCAQRVDRKATGLARRRQ
jgi:hypothetical protein